MSRILSTGGGGSASGRGSGPRGCLLPGGLLEGACFSGGCLLPGGCLLGGSCPRGVPAPGGPAPGGGARWRHAPRTATAAGGTHPIGMHSCFVNIFTSVELERPLETTHDKNLDKWAVFIQQNFYNALKCLRPTRMHSSSMRTARSLTMGGVYLPRGCTCPGGCTVWGCTCLGVYLPRGVPARGMYLPKGGIPALRVCTCLGVPALRVCTCLGVPAQGGVPVQGVPDQLRDTCPGGPAQVLPPWIEFLTHATENITLPQLCCGRKWLFKVLRNSRDQFPFPDIFGVEIRPWCWENCQLCIDCEKLEGQKKKKHIHRDSSLTDSSWIHLILLIQPI